MVTTKEHFVPTFFADCTVWPLANFVNFRVIPLVYRASFTAFVQLLWQSYLSFVSHVDDEKVAAGDVNMVVKPIARSADETCILDRPVSTMMVVNAHDQTACLRKETATDI